MEDRSNCARLVPNPLHVLQKDLLAAAVIEFRGPAVGMAGDSLSGFKGAVILQKICDTGRPESMIADARLYAGGFGPALDDAIGVLLAKGLSVKRPVFPAAVRNR